MNNTQVTIKGFREFVANKPQDEKFNYESITDCAFAQYLKSLNFTGVYVLHNTWEAKELTVIRDIPDEIKEAITVPATDEGDAFQTWGELALKLG